MKDLKLKKGEIICSLNDTEIARAGWNTIPDLSPKP